MLANEALFYYYRTMWFLSFKIMQQLHGELLHHHHQRLCLEAWYINSAHAPLNRDDGGLLPDAYLHLVRKKGR